MQDGASGGGAADTFDLEELAADVVHAADAVEAGGEHHRDDHRLP